MQNGIAEATTGLVKSRRLSFQQKTETTASTAASAAASSSPGVNGKEPTSKQRNWFPNLEKSSNNNDAPAKAPETSVESSRRESVKNDSVPQTVSNLMPESPSQSQSPQSLSQPGDRRPILGARNSSDSIEDYIRNWKKGEQQEGGGSISSNDNDSR